MLTSSKMVQFDWFYYFHVTNWKISVITNMINSGVARATQGARAPRQDLINLSSIEFHTQLVTIDRS